MKSIQTQILELLLKHDRMTFLDIVKALNTDYALTRACVMQMSYYGKIIPVGLDSYEVV